MKNLTFGGRTKARPVTILADDAPEPKEGEEVQPTHELREMKAAKRDKYMDKMSQRLIINPKGDVVGIKKFDGMHRDLLIECLWDLKAEKLVTAEQLADWPSGTVAVLFEAAQELNHLRKPSELNRIASEQVAKWLKEEKQVEVDPIDIELVIEESGKKYFAEKDGSED